MNDHDANDAALRAQLRAAFQPPPAAEFAAMAAAVTSSPDIGAGRRRWPWWILAAAAAVLAAVLLLPGPKRGPQGHDGRELGALWAAAYQDAMKRGFEDPTCCTGVDLEAVCRTLCCTQVELPETSDVALLGGYCGLPTGGCTMLLARHDSAPVCIHLLPRAKDPGVQLPPGSGLHLARRELGDVVLYALCPDGAAATLAEFRVAID